MTMKLISTVVRPDRLPQVKAALFRAGVTGITISRVSGHGGERELQEHYRGGTVVLEFREKVRLEMAVSEPFVEPTIDRKSTRLNSSHITTSYAVFCLNKKKRNRRLRS